MAIISSAAAAADGFCVLLLWQQHRLLLSLFAISVLLLFPLPTLRLFPPLPSLHVEKADDTSKQERGDSKSKENAKSSRVGLEKDSEVVRNLTEKIPSAPLDKFSVITTK